MKLFKLYKHKNCTDIAIMPGAVYDDKTKDYIEAFVFYVNIVNEPIRLKLQETIKINRTDLKNWELYE